MCLLVLLSSPVFSFHFHRLPLRCPVVLNSLNDCAMELCEENADILIDEIRRELGTIFGYDPKSREVGITGAIDLVELDGPVLVVSLKGIVFNIE